jgi:hypothetical protein
VRADGGGVRQLFEARLHNGAAGVHEDGRYIYDAPLRNYHVTINATRNHAKRHAQRWTLLERAA